MAENKLKALFGNALTPEFIKLLDTLYFHSLLTELMKPISKESPHVADSEHISHFDFQLFVCVY